MRKAWDYIIRTYRADYDNLRTTGGEGYDKYWEKKHKKMRLRYETLNEFMQQKNVVEEATMM